MAHKPDLFSCNCGSVVSICKSDLERRIRVGVSVVDCLNLIELTSAKCHILAKMLDICSLCITFQHAAHFQNDNFFGAQHKIENDNKINLKNLKL